MYVLILELSDHGRFAGLSLEVDLSPAERRLRIRRQERIISNTRVGLEKSLILDVNNIVKELKHLHVKLTALRAGATDKIMTLAAFMEKMTKK